MARKAYSLCGEVVIYKIVILSLFACMGMGLTWKYTLDHRIAYNPLYHVGDCFKFRYDLDNHADGVIKLRHDDVYSILWFKEADKRYGGPKVGAEVPVKLVDEYTYKVKCPKGWQKG